ncbi:hypothetical protein Pcinc_028810 [Petrolisthes cinctipes]|uniref:Uncharacterized protein n=1 Tax=Petrolisthes cinctipes TaxID=88211 RepID=A0AAE1K8S9_PETCI|nr:hypothetical protein Pcinc_028810 [Petrolisthes cinctipes]
MVLMHLLPCPALPLTRPKPSLPVPTPRCPHSTLFPIHAVTTPRCHHSTLSPLHAVLTPRCPHSTLFPLHAVPTPRCPHSTLSPLHAVPTPRCPTPPTPITLFNQSRSIPSFHSAQPLASQPKPTPLSPSHDFPRSLHSPVTVQAVLHNYIGV